MEKQKRWKSPMYIFSEKRKTFYDGARNVAGKDMMMDGYLQELILILLRSFFLLQKEKLFNI